ncbi:MAG: RNA polymerase sigma factor [Clostridia bacterium]|nr:RNA polymerase sigma factor [Clostridia bacterium]
MRGFEQVFERYYPRVYRFVLALCRDNPLAEELTQQTFFKALQSIGTFRGECRLDVWLCQIAKHEYYAHTRRQRRDADPPFVLPDPTGHEPVLALVQREEARSVHRALHLLGEPYKEVFSLRVFGELPFLEIAQLFEKTESWARVTYYRAKLKIQELIKEDVE